MKQIEKDLLEKKKSLEKKISDAKGMEVLGWIILILLFWTIIGLIIGLILLITYNEKKEKARNELIEVNYKLSKI